MRKSSLALLALLATSTATHSQSLIPDLDAPGTRGEMARAEKKKAEVRFDAMDGSKDGKLSRDEVTGKSDYLASNFDKLDSNKDGVLSWEEFLGHNRWPK
ncbi:MAG: EF-hand domain-containing protein [Rhodocyclales bacterium]|nr:EF-hand domain-containing protein [Rhodocyclales bacterium]